MNIICRIKGHNYQKENLYYEVKDTIYDKKLDYQNVPTHIYYRKDVAFCKRCGTTIYFDISTNTDETYKVQLKDN